MKKNKDKITIDLRKIKLILQPIVTIIIAFWFLVWSFINFFIPVILIMVRGLIIFVKLWIITENESMRFFGGLIFLFIGYKVYEVLIILWFKFFNITISYTTKF